jgi:hypothetical protein
MQVGALPPNPRISRQDPALKRKFSSLEVNISQWQIFLTKIPDRVPSSRDALTVDFCSWNRRWSRVTNNPPPFLAHHSRKQMSRRT